MTREQALIDSFARMAGAWAKLPFAAADGFLNLVEEGGGNPFLPLWFAWVHVLTRERPSSRRWVDRS